MKLDLFALRHLRQSRPRGSGRVVRVGPDAQLVSGKDAGRLWRQVGRYAKRAPSWFVGKFVKVPLRAPDGSGEFIWTEALEVRGGQVCGVLNNEPLKLPGMHRGDPICFAPGEAMAVMTPAQAAAAVRKGGGRTRGRAALRTPGERFRSLVARLAARGAADPKALAAWIGRKKYGKQRFQAMALAGRKQRS